MTASVEVPGVSRVFFEIFVLCPVQGPVGPRVPVRLLRGAISGVNWPCVFENGAYPGYHVKADPIWSDLEERLYFRVS